MKNKTKCDGKTHYTPTSKRGSVVADCDCKKENSPTEKDNFNVSVEHVQDGSGQCVETCEACKVGVCLEDHSPTENSAYTPMLSCRQIGDYTSWFNIYEDGLIDAQIQFCVDGWRAQQKAERIIRAVNGHADLLQAFKEISIHLRGKCDHETQDECDDCIGLIVRDSIAKAEGKI